MSAVAPPMEAAGPAVPVRPTRISGPRAVVAVAALVVAAAAVALFIGRGSPSPAPTGFVGPAATFSLPELREGRPDVSLASAPGHPVVVNFFAAWCVPCRTELPALRDAAAAHPDITFVGVDHQDSRDDAIEILDKSGVTYPAGYDPRGETATKYGLRGLPATAFIDPRGRIVELHQGALSAKEIEVKLQHLTLQSKAA